MKAGELAALRSIVRRHATGWYIATHDDGSLWWRPRLEIGPPEAVTAAEEAAYAAALDVPAADTATGHDVT